MRPFIKGLELSERFYREAVAPILAQRFPKLRYSAALIGPGSDVLGFDTPQSMDHDWGPRLLLFLGEADASDDLLYLLNRALAREMLENDPEHQRLPAHHRGRGAEPRRCYCGAVPHHPER